MLHLHQKVRFTCIRGGSRTNSAVQLRATLVQPRNQLLKEEVAPRLMSVEISQNQPQSVMITNEQLTAEKSG